MAVADNAEWGGERVVGVIFKGSHSISERVRGGG